MLFLSASKTHPKLVQKSIFRKFLSVSDKRTFIQCMCLVINLVPPGAKTRLDEEQNQINVIGNSF